ncbi:MAG: tRNA (N6-isopentenyl adenosine(37)-C2)-methylthiotransferase MiaB [Alphaproteobacteria bacterium]|nr:tRNA (N6-isopentenyl adenosine(37)-C2)-methylthiotransferase MiaB [Alphaproteobacteria bacterium]
MEKSFYIEVYGCQMNVYDSRRIAELLLANGFVQSPDPHDAEILIFYTCNVREKAAQRLFSNIGFLRSNKTEVIAVGGCVSQAEGTNIFRNKHINISFGAQTYHRLPEHINSILSGKKAQILDLAFDEGTKFRHLAPSTAKASHSEFVTIQEGCDNFCAYCVVPYTRGREYSRPAKDVIAEAREFIARGAKEITLIGQNVNSYHGEAPYITVGQPKETWRLERLIREIALLDGLKRLRYTTSHPKDFTAELMRVHAETPVLTPFAHIPVQSGNDRILKLMNRGHTARAYLDKLAMFRDICPSIQFSSDFIVGFPTETDTEFEDTVNLAEAARYTISYSFKYSRRKNTPADKMDGQIPERIKEERLALLQETLLKSQVEHNRALVGTTQEVLFDRVGRKENQYIGKNVYLQSVIVESSENLIGEFRNVLVEQSGENSVSGRVL